MRLDVVTGSVLGREHARLLRNNQDAVGACLDADRAVIAVADGCSSARSSEVGAKLACAWIAARAPGWLDAHPDATPEATAGALFDGVLAFVGDAARALSPAPAVARGEVAGPSASPAVVGELFLFTLLVAVVDRRRALVFGVGDGVVVLDDRVVVLDAGPRNAPAYPAYALLDPSALDEPPPCVAPVLHHVGPADGLHTLALATDGAAELEARRGGVLRDGARQEGLARLVGDPRLLDNPSLLEKRLRALGAVNGRLADDTTIAVIRRTPSCAVEASTSVEPLALVEVAGDGGAS